MAQGYAVVQVHPVGMDLGHGRVEMQGHVTPFQSRCGTLPVEGRVSGQDRVAEFDQVKAR